MALANDYNSVMSRKGEIMKKSVGIDYSRFESGSIAFDYEKMMRETGYTLEEMQKIQQEVHVGNTPIIELRNITALARKCAKPGYGARIFIKDEACNPSGSFKARRAANSVYHAKKLGFKGVVTATSGNYGAAVASQAAMAGLKCIVVQECYDSKGVGQPEIIEKARKCEALGAEVVQLSVGPELFYKFLLLLEETGYFNASLYTFLASPAWRRWVMRFPCNSERNSARIPMWWFAPMREAETLRERQRPAQGRSVHKSDWGFREFVGTAYGIGHTFQQKVLYHRSHRVWNAL